MATACHPTADKKMLASAMQLAGGWIIAGLTTRHPLLPMPCHACYAMPKQ